MTAHAPAKPQKLNPGKAVSRLGRLDVGKGGFPAERLAKYSREEGGRDGASCRTRTDDRSITNRVLYQLS